LHQAPTPPHNWGTAAKFFQALGYQLEFETDHKSGQLRNGDGPYVFIAEVPDDQPTGIRLVMGVVTPFQPTRWGTQEMTVRDPDGRLWSLQAPTGS
jgi:hypothetical protein